MLADASGLARAAAEHFVGLAASAISAHGRFAVALAGGETPRGMYAQLSSAAFAERVAWPQVHVFWGDERCVAPGHPESNYRMARETLLDKVPLPTANIHRMRGEREPAQAAIEYARELRHFFAQPSQPGADEALLPRLDLILLGMGGDGHTASLFPGTAALRERRRWVVAHYVEPVHSWRMTLTLPAINAAAQVTFIISGKAKAERLRQVLAGADAANGLPAQMVNPTDGRLLWLVDADAASLLPR